MKKVRTKLQNHSKKIIVHLKRHHKKYLFGALCSGILALIGIFTVKTINNTFADEPEVKILTAENFTGNCTTGDAGDNLYDIWCTGKNLDGIAYGAFGEYSEKINTLDLSYNNISSLEFYYKYDNNPQPIKVKKLNLSHNKITKIKSIFEKSHELHSIAVVVTKVYIHEIQEQKNIWGYLYLQSGGSIDFSYNEITSIESGTFSDLYLESIYLNNNKLSKLDFTVFEGINALETLDISFNQIFDLKLKAISSLINLSVSGNCLVPSDLNLLSSQFTNIEILGKEGQKACFHIEYNPNSPTSGDVGAKLTLTGHGSFIDGYSQTTGFENTGTKYFDVSNLVDLSGEINDYPESGLIAATVTWIDKEAPSCDVRYSTTGPTSQDVTAKLTGCSERIICNNCDSGTTGQHLFTGNNNFTFEFRDAVGNTGSADASVTRIDKNIPTCTVEYSTTGWTNQTVTATLTGCNKTGITVTQPNGSWTYPFNTSGTFTFEFVDAVGNTGSTGASVTWIDKEEPECGIWYETQGETGHESTTARLTGCSDDFDKVINTSGNVIYYVIGYSGEFTFQFIDRANNTGTAKASVNMPKYTIQVNNSGEMLSLYSGNNAISCEYIYESGTDYEQILLYVKNGKIYGSYTFSGGSDEEYYNDNTLFKNNMMYYWGTSLGSGLGMWVEYDDFNVEDAFDSIFRNLDSNDIFMCSTGVEDTSVFTVPDGIVFYNQDHYSYDEDVSFVIRIDNTINVGEYAELTIRVMKDDSIYEDYTGTIIIALMDNNGDYVDSNYYTVANHGLYDFERSDKGRKTFENGLKVKRAGTYVLQIEGLNGGMSEETITVKGNGNNNYDEFEYDTLKFNPYYSDEMNKAYQYARYYDITTRDTIKDANMNSGLNRIAMAKMLANYAENVLGIDNFDTSRDCTFNDVTVAMDKQYDYGVTKVCQLGIMGVNTPNHKFYPKGGVTRAEFATALSRLLYNTKDGTNNYYSTHISKLYREGIIKNTDPTLREKRGYVMLMLMRAEGKYNN